MVRMVNMSDFGNADGRRAFVTAFTKSPYAFNTEPLHLAVYEADLWALQRTSGWETSPTGSG